MAVPRTILFDLDGTLIDSVPDIAPALNRLLAARGLPGFAEQAVAGMMGDGAKVLVTRALAARDRTPDDATVAEFIADYTAHNAERTFVYPGVAAALERLAQDGWRMAVCTNKPAVAAHSVLAALGLGRWIAAVGGGDSFATRKPDPAHLLATLAAAGGERGRAVMVGDQHNDVAAAMGCGMPCVFAAWGYGPIETGAAAAAVARSADELPGLLDAVMPA